MLNDQKRGVILVCYDTPMKDNKEKREYVDFRKNLLKEGFKMIQKSVYVLLIENYNHSETIVKRVERIAPENSNVLIVPMSLYRFLKSKKIGDANIDLGILVDDMVFVQENYICYNRYNI